MTVAAEKKAASLGLSGLPDGVFFSSIKDAKAFAKKSSVLRGQLHHIQRAFEALELDGVLCVDSKPTAFFRKFSQPITRQIVDDLQLKAWNQSSATLLVLQDPRHNYLYSCLTYPEDASSEGLEEHRGFITDLETGAEVLSSYRLAEKLASGHLYRQYPASFQSNESIDRHLVGNLEALSEKMLGRRSRKNLPLIHSFLGRVIFTRYLLDRGVISLSDYIKNPHASDLNELLSNLEADQVKEALFGKLFPALRREFNGSMFGDEIAEEKKLIGKPEITLLESFFRGDDMESSQPSLGFWAYDFSIIPVEIISAIYEKFLGLESPKEKERKGAYYTPKNLAEMTVAEALDGEVDIITKRFLDPSCGSGVFLVILFSRLAEEWSLKYPRATVPKKMDSLIGFLKNNLRGVDVNGTACRLTCFSLYIALLDQFDPLTLRQLKEEVGKGTRSPLLPAIFAALGSSPQKTVGKTIIEGDFFDKTILSRETVDFIIGNPPWVSRGEITPSLKEWLESPENEYREEFKSNGSNSREIFLPQKQIAHAFLWKSALHLDVKGRGCMILPSQLLTNKTDVFQREWFSRFDTKRVVHLADFRRFLFENAIRPCLLFHFQKSTPKRNGAFEYAVPKVTRLDPRSGHIPVCADDRKWIALEELLQATDEKRAAILWKTKMWASEVDLDLIEALSTLPKIGDYAGSPNDGKRWIKGAGFKPWYQAAFEKNPDKYGQPKPIPGVLSDPFVRTARLPHYFLCKSDCDTLGEILENARCKGIESVSEKLRASKNGFHRSPDKRVFEPPVLLLNEGFTKFCISESKIFFQDAVRAIHVPKEDLDHLYLLCALLDSDLAAYFAFHSSSSSGIERERVFVHEVMSLPFFIPEDSHSKKIGKQIASKIKAEKKKVESTLAQSFTLSENSSAEERAHLVASLRDQLEPLIYKYFSLEPQDIALIEDTISIYKPSVTPESSEKDIPTARRVTDANLSLYCEWLTKQLNDWAEKNQSNARTRVLFKAEYGVLNDLDLALVVLRKSRKETSPQAMTTHDRLEEALAKLAEESSEQVGAFEYLRGILHGSTDGIYLAKPALLGQWTRSRALEDACRVFGAIVGASTKKKT